MNTLYYDCAVIGAGAAGLCAGAAAAGQNLKTIIIDRESLPGGVLLQCIHNGFGLHYFKEQLTGPEYAEKVTENMTLHTIKFFALNRLNEICYDKRAPGSTHSSLHGAKSFIL